MNTNVVMLLFAADNSSVTVVHYIGKDVEIKDPAEIARLRGAGYAMRELRPRVVPGSKVAPIKAATCVAA